MDSKARYAAVVWVNGEPEWCVDDTPAMAAVRAFKLLRVLTRNGVITAANGEKQRLQLQAFRDAQDKETRAEYNRKYSLKKRGQVKSTT